MADVEGEAAPKKKSDLGIRTLSAIVMLAVFIGAIWLGGLWLKALIALVGLIAMAEMARLVVKAVPNMPVRIIALLAGLGYIGVAVFSLLGLDPVLLVLAIGVVIFVDTFAYFFGRTIGGPKIAPAISPSKTWAGLLGGVVGASLFLLALAWFAGQIAQAFATSNAATGMSLLDFAKFIAIGAALAVSAQAGDFLESWLKRKAGVKDSSNLIPGHGGVFDRVDGLLPVAIIAGIAQPFIIV